jgi:hypothetical protein
MSESGNTQHSAVIAALKFESLNRASLLTKLERASKNERLAPAWLWRAPGPALRTP